MKNAYQKDCPLMLRMIVILRKWYLSSPDIICLQEIGVLMMLDRIKFNGYEYTSLNYSTNPARGRGQGYSGTAIISRIKPINIVHGLETLDEVDCEGRVITVEFEKYFLINVYTPNSGTNEEYRINKWDISMLKYIKNLEKTKPVVFTGDMNVCHTELDLHKKMPKVSERIAGFSRKKE